jgi:SPX domain protein involved in polyphosphate accumulation
VSYKALKQTIKAHMSVESHLTTFVYLLDREVEKVSAFYNYKRAELDRQWCILYEQYLKVDVEDQGGIAGMKAAFVECRDEIKRVLRFCELNTMAIHKILKK